MPYSLGAEWNECYLVELKALAPFGERDAVVVVLVTEVQEWPDAMLQSHQRRADREQLVTGYESIIILMYI